jgi:hypothetical protein
MIINHVCLEIGTHTLLLSGSLNSIPLSDERFNLFLRIRDKYVSEKKTKSTLTYDALFYAFAFTGNIRPRTLPMPAKKTLN